MGELFGMGQSQANEWTHELLPILKQVLDDLGYAPERDLKKFKKKEQDRKDAVNSIIDGTERERRRQRPKKAEKQSLHYSGKKKIYSLLQLKKAAQAGTDCQRERSQSQDIKSPCAG